MRPQSTPLGCFVDDTMKCMVAVDVILTSMDAIAIG